jgi:hypothetical protein
VLQHSQSNNSNSILSVLRKYFFENKIFRNALIFAFL